MNYYKEIQNILKNLIPYTFTLKKNEYYKFIINDVIYFTYSPVKIHNEYIENALIIGKPILKCDDNYKLLPGILNVIEIPNNFSVTQKQAIKISYGKNVIVNCNDGYFLVKDKYNTSISIGKVKDGLFYPDVDLGIYLRDEKL